MARTFDLIDAPPMTMEYKGKTYQLCPWFDNVLLMLRSLDGLDGADRMEIMCDFLVNGDHPHYDPDFFAALADIFFQKAESDGSPRAMDFEQDAALIYAAFRQIYGIDLHAEIGKMHWNTFCALMEGLPATTRFSDIISIRTRPLPAPNKNNAAERAELARLKQKYRIRLTEDERENGFQKGLAKMAQCLIAMAQEGENNG